MHHAGQEVPADPTIPTKETRILRARLVWSELVKEMIGEGLGVAIRVSDSALDNSGGDITLCDDDNLDFACEKSFDLIAAVDGCVDGSVVTIGTLSALGVPDQPFLELVDENNLAKFGPGGYRNEQGKWVKPPGHTPPDIAGLLARVINGHTPTRTTAQDRINKALEVCIKYGGIDGAHHKTWVIDQVVRFLTGDKYDEVVKEACDGEDGPNTYDWDTGVAP